MDDILTLAPPLALYDAACDEMQALRDAIDAADRENHLLRQELDQTTRDQDAADLARQLEELKATCVPLVRLHLDAPFREYHFVSRMELIRLGDLIATT
jgi:hypothetical protein